MGLIRFIELSSKLELNENPLVILKRLMKAYDSKERRYHNIHHIGQCLDEFEHVRSIAQQPQLIEYAIWFHDYVYDIKAQNNEEKSLDAALMYLPKENCKDEMIETVSRLILATKHSQVPQSIDEKIIADVDLSILGQKPIIYNTYKEYIYEEFEQTINEIGINSFLSKRKEFLQSMLSLDNIYCTEIFQKLYEASARINIKKEIKEIEKNSF